MSDFARARGITTLERLNETHLQQIEAELNELAQRTPIALVLPCHAADLHGPALAHIAEELSGAEFLKELVLTINGSVAGPLPQWAGRMTVLWRDTNVREVPTGSGKGGNVAAAFSYLQNNTDCAIYATQDCDVISFRRSDLARLCYALAHPRLGFRFAKMYQSRATTRLYGRVGRLFVAPLLAALVEVAGPLRLIGFLRSFHHSLSGEVALTREVASALPASNGWALEIGQLCAVFRSVDSSKICEVEGSAGYDHRHHPAGPVLAGMATEIGSELFTQLAAEGLVDSRGFRSALHGAFFRETERAILQSEKLARINALPFDEAAERELASLFGSQLANLPLASAAPTSASAALERRGSSSA